MQRFALIALTVSLITLSGSTPADAHCEVPCGIYADQMRFERMLEDTATMEKAMGQINELAAKNDGQSANQLVRWVTTKEEHATNTQHIIAQYFMTQRLKPEMDGYVEKLVAAHAVMRHAMKCKQSTDVKHAAALKDAIVAFHKAYAGK